MLSNIDSVTYNIIERCCGNGCNSFEEITSDNWTFPYIASYVISAGLLIKLSDSAHNKVNDVLI